jgi:hypothetical protein
VTTPTSTTTATFALRTRFVDNERSTEKVFPVQSRDRFFRFRVIADFSEAKSPRLARKTIAKQR